MQLLFYVVVLLLYLLLLLAVVAFDLDGSDTSVAVVVVSFVGLHIYFA